MAREREEERGRPRDSTNKEKGREDTKSEHGSSKSGDDLEEREYIDEQGNIRHHTKKYMEDHRGE